MKAALFKLFDFAAFYFALAIVILANYLSLFFEFKDDQVSKQFCISAVAPVQPLSCDR